jgi:diguanylate cyclase (GGDEF)-like protein
MTRLISSVASLTDLRDRDELEVTLASVMFDLVGPSKLTLWRVVSYLGSLRLRRRAQIEVGNRVAVSDLLTDPQHLPTLNSHKELLACCDANVPQRAAPGKDGQYRHIYPVSTGKHVIGLLQIDHPMPLREYQERLVLGLLRIYRNHLAVLDDSEYDELTGLLNRKTFEQHFRRLAAPRPPPAINTAQGMFIGDRRSAAPEQHPWLAVVDIDFFKRINDEFGHLHGDEILLLLARLLRNTFRDSDRIFRFGGEEFVIALGFTEAAAVGHTLERGRAAIEGFAFPQVGRVTVSIGYTRISPTDIGSDAFGRADSALYAAKQNGRNQVQSYEVLVDRGVLSTITRVSGDLELF